LFKFLKFLGNLVYYTDGLSKKSNHKKIMAEIAGQLPLQIVSTDSKKSKSADEKYDAREKIESTHTSELVIALCGPIGSPLHEVAETIKKVLLKEFDYEKCEILKLSKFIEERYEIDTKNKINTVSPFERTDILITKGDDLRKEHGNDVLAAYAVSKIAFDRKVAQKEENEKKFPIGEDIQPAPEKYQPRRICHIIDSIKNQEELETLKLVYRDMLYSIGVYSPLPVREKALKDKGMKTDEIYKLIDRDSGEEIDHGQTVRDTFPKSDFFLRIDSKINSLIERKVKRFLDLILQTRVITPWASETAMYLAASAAGNSACLSRQVGAALTDEKDEVISVGWNDVPKFEGGLYMSADSLSEDKDQRCWNLEGGICFNDKEKQDRAELLVADLIKAKIITEEQRETALAKVKGSNLKSLIEFSRAIHAEMHAIILGSQVGGARVRGGKLYCTTYPCHSCARHIVVSGVKEVYYIEPYRKSLAIKLHSDAISESETDIDKVRILPYDGVSPSRYLKLFRVESDARKTKEGKLPIVNPRKAQPKFLKTMEALPVLEAIVVKGLADKHLISITEEVQEEK